MINMPYPTFITQVAAIATFSPFLLPALVIAADKAEPATYEPTVESLRQSEIPEWFIDGKLGIFMHWGPESIPGVASTWYARWMYEEGSEGYKYHCATYGHPSKFGYKDICKLFKAKSVFRTWAGMQAGKRDNK